MSQADRVINLLAFAYCELEHQGLSECLRKLIECDIINVARQCYPIYDIVDSIVFFIFAAQTRLGKCMASLRA